MVVMVVVMPLMWRRMQLDDGDDKVFGGCATKRCGLMAMAMSLWRRSRGHVFFKLQILVSIST